MKNSNKNKKSNQEIIIGFTLGVVKHFMEPMSNETLQMFLDAGANALEISFIKLERLEKIPLLEINLIKKFKHVSIHLPKIEYRNDKATKDILEKISGFATKINAVVLVLHPDLVKEWQVIEDLGLPIGIENMNASKETGKTVEQLTRIFKSHDLKFVLDTNHVYSVDSSMKLNGDMINAFSHRLVEVHASATSKEEDHISFLNAHQEFLIKAIPAHVPIILETAIHDECSASRLKKELSYVKKFLQE